MVENKFLSLPMIEEIYDHSVTVKRELHGIRADNVLNLDQLVYSYLTSKGFLSSASSFIAESKVKADKICCKWSLQDLVTEGFLHLNKKLAAQSDIAEIDIAFNTKLSLHEEKPKTACCSPAQPIHIPKRRERRHPNYEKTLDRYAQDSYFSALSTLSTQSSDLHIPSTEIPCSDIKIFEGHTGMVMSCAWNPTHASILASGSGDSVATIWDVTDGSSKLLHCPCGPLVKRSNNISQVAWNPDGTLLATASHTGKASIWSITGDLKHSIDGHRQPLTSIKWSKGGSYLLTGSTLDDNGYLWCSHTGTKSETVGFCPAYADWRSDDSFSAKLSLYKADGVHVKSFLHHQSGEKLYVAKWNPEGTLLAAGYLRNNNLAKVKIWNMAKDDFPIHSLEKHTSNILDIGWSPDSSLLASGSADQTLKLWNVEHGKEVGSFYHPRGPVSALAFDPHGSYLVTASSKTLNVLSVKEGKIIKTFEAKGEVCQASWNNDGSKIAVCFEDDSSLYVIDMNL